MGRYSLILIVGFALVAGGLKLTLQRVGREAGNISNDKYERSVARSTAHSAAQLALYELKKDLDWRSGYNNLGLGDGEATVTVVDASTDSTLGPDTIRVESNGSFDEEDVLVAMKVALGHPDFPDNIKAGITAQTNIGTLGNMFVDGRDHDINGNLIADNGTKAIVTTETYSPGGSTSLAGTTDAGNDYGPVRVNYNPIVTQNYTWPGTYPTTPEDVLGGASEGIPANALKMAAMSGQAGSQYVTNPADLTFPLRGVTYVELPNEGIWRPVDFGSDGSGIVVVHNSQLNATMYDVNQGLFRGLIITDNILHIQGTVIGGIFVITPNPPGGNCIGNGIGNVFFSRDAIIQALEDAQIGLTNVSVIECWE